MATTVYIAGLPASASDIDLRRMIEPHGTIRAFSMSRDTETQRCTGNAFIEMTDDTASYAVIRAINGATLDHSVLHADLIVSGDMGMAPRGAAGPARIATVQEATLAWERLESWLKANAYPIWYSLNHIALDPEIDSALVELGGIALPVDLRIAYNRHNGQAAPPMFAGRFRYCSLFDVIDRWNTLNAMAQQLSEEEYWHPLWIPLTDHDSGDCHFINLNPEDPDCGRIFFWSMVGDAYPVAENFTAFVADLAEGLETGRYFADNNGVTDASARWL